MSEDFIKLNPKMNFDFVDVMKMMLSAITDRHATVSYLPAVPED